MKAKVISDITNPLLLAELETFPHQAMIWDLLGNPHKRQIWGFGEQAIMIMENNCDDPYIFVTGVLDSSIVREIKTLCNVEFPYLYCAPVFHHLFLAEGWDLHLRIEFSYIAPPHTEVNNIPENFSICPIDNLELFKQCIEFEVTCGRYGSAENFLKYGKGYALCNGTQIVSEAYSNYQSQDYAEIGIATHPDYLRKGMATKIGSYWVKKCIEQHKIPVWSCNADNKASINTAIKIGFRVERYYIQLVPDVGNVHGPKLEAWIKKQNLSQ